MNNKNLRLLSAEDEQEYRDQEAMRRFEKQQQRIQANNDSKHVLDPDREWRDGE